MVFRLKPSIALCALLPALAACKSEPPGPPALSDQALAAITANAGAPTRQLAREIDDVFTMEGLGETHALVLLQGGRIAAERYAPGYDRDTRFISWSMAKTVTGVMIGMLVADGRLRLDDPPPVPRWQRPGDPRGEITLRQLLQMRSGLRHTELEDPLYEDLTVRMLLLDGRDDMADFATAQPLEHEPGQVFEYSSATSIILADIAARVLSGSEDRESRRQAVDAFLRARLFEPLGMDSMVAEYDASGTLIGGSLMHGTARDWARFGDFLRNKGSYRGVQIVPRSWVEKMIAPSPRASHYGFHVWLNRPAGDEQLHSTYIESAPRTVFALAGFGGQLVYSSPSQRVTLVRLGQSSREERELLTPQLGDILALYPER